MAEDVKIPGIKKPVPKWLAIAGVAGTGVLIIIYYRQKSSASAASPGSAAPGTAGAGAAVPTSGTQGDLYPWDGTYDDSSDPYSMDTTTGVTYGDEGAFGGTSPDTDTGGGGGPVGTSGLAGPPFSNNSEWSTYVIAQLEANDYTLNTTTVQNAVGAYLNGQPLTSAQRTIVFDAIAVGGSPPVAGAGGYPPAVKGDGSKGGATPTKGITLNQPHTISSAQAQELWKAGRSDVYWKTSAGSYVATKTSEGVGQLYTGAQGWAYLTSQAKKKK